MLIEVRYNNEVVKVMHEDDIKYVSPMQLQYALKYNEKVNNFGFRRVNQHFIPEIPPKTKKHRYFLYDIVEDEYSIVESNRFKYLPFDINFFQTIKKYNKSKGYIGFENSDTKSVKFHYYLYKNIRFEKISGIAEYLGVPEQKVFNTNYYKYKLNGYFVRKIEREMSQLKIYRNIIKK